MCSCSSKSRSGFYTSHVLMYFTNCFYACYDNATGQIISQKQLIFVSCFGTWDMIIFISTAPNRSLVFAGL